MTIADFIELVRPCAGPYLSREAIWRASGTDRETGLYYM